MKPCQGNKYIGIATAALVLACVIYGVALHGYSGSSDGAVTVLKDDAIYIRSDEPYTDNTVVHHVEHPAYLRAGNEQYVMTLLGAGSATWNVTDSASNLSYSLSMYAEPDSARQELAQFKGLSSAEILSIEVNVTNNVTHNASSLSTSSSLLFKEGFSSEANAHLAPAFFKAIEHDNGDYAMRMVLTRNVDIEVAHSLFGYSVLTRLKQESKYTASRVTIRFLDLFNKTRAGDVLRRTKYHFGDVLLFSVTHHDFYFSVNNKIVGSIQDEPMFAQVFMSIFFCPYNPARPAFADRAPLLWMRGELFLGLSEWGANVPTTKNGWFTLQGQHPYNITLTLWGKSAKIDYMGAVDHSLDTWMFGLYKFGASVALYADASQIKLGSSTPINSLSRRALLDAIRTATNVTRGFRFKIHQFITATALRDVLLEAMNTTMVARLNPRRYEEAVKQFTSMFSNVTEFNKEHDLLHLMCDAEQRLVAVFDRKSWKVVTVDSPTLCEALFQAYLGTPSALIDQPTDFVSHILP